tara:strand:+ start:450 stop:680 length:231 start_codon:yes stop_codon:yes gene_type:complete
MIGSYQEEGGLWNILSIFEPIYELHILFGSPHPTSPPSEGERRSGKVNTIYQIVYTNICHIFEILFMGILPVVFGL